MRDDTYIGLFRAFPKRDWRVKFPDLPGCEATGSSLQETLESARVALTDHLYSLGAKPRPRSRTELLNDAQRDWLFCREFVDAVLIPVDPETTDHCPLPHSMETRQGTERPLENPQETSNAPAFPFRHSDDVTGRSLLPLVLGRDDREKRNLRHGPGAGLDVSERRVVAEIG